MRRLLNITVLLIIPLVVLFIVLKYLARSLNSFLISRFKLYAKYWRWRYHKHIQIAVSILGSFTAIIVIFVTLHGAFALSTWVQSDWSGGVGSSTTNQYSSGSNVTTSTANQVTISQTANQFSNNNFLSDLSSWTAGYQPNNISGLQLWLKADAIVGLSNNAAVSTWTDSSGSSNNATQATNAEQPVYKTNAMNSLPAVYFNGSGDFLSTPSLTGQSIFAVINHADGGSFTNYRRIVDNGDTYGYSIFGVSGTSTYNPTSFPRGITASNFWVNGTNTLAAGTLANNRIISAIATSPSTNNNWIGTYVGSGAQSMYGDIAEVLIYSGALTTSQRQSVENYLASKYNIADSGGVTATRNTTTTYNGDTASTQLVANSAGYFTQNINVGNTNSYNLSTYAYTNGSAISASNLQLYTNGNAITTTYTSVGGGWYQLTGTVTGVNSSVPYGVQVASGQTVYVDDFNLSNYNTSSTLISNIFDTGQAENYGNLTYSATIPSGSTVSVLVRAGNQSNLSDASAFSSCSPIASGSAIASSCAPNGSRYVQYELEFTSNAYVTPTFSSITIAYSPTDTTPPATNASNIALTDGNGGSSVVSNGWANTNPYFTWTAATDHGGGSGIAGYCLYLGTDPTGNPVISKGLLGTSPLSTGGACQFAVSTTSVDTSLSGYLASALTSSTTPYYLNIIAITGAGYVWTGSSAQFQFRYDITQPNNPSFISAPSNFVSSKAVDLTWPTSGSNEASDSISGVAGLQYKIGSGGTWYGSGHSGTQDFSDLLTNNGSYTMQNSPDFPNLQEGDNIVYFRTWSNSGLASTAYVTAVIKINTTSPSSPQNVTATPGTNTTNSFAFSWLAPTTYAGSTANITYCYTVNAIPNSNNCNFTSAGVTSLSAGAYATEPGDNTFYVVAKDEAGNINYATYGSTTFTANTPAPGIPLNLDVGDISVKASSLWKLALSWEQPSTVGAGISTYKVDRSTDGINFTIIASTAGASYVDTGLTQQLYYYKVQACDSANNCGAFTVPVSLTPTGKFTSPANIVSGPNVSDSTRTATMTWSTDRNSDSSVEYGLSSGNYFQTQASNSSQVTSHNVSLNNLVAGTTYFYRALWTDGDGNVGTSIEGKFTTLPAPVVSNVTVTGINLHNATINFTSTSASQVKLYFGGGGAKNDTQVLNTSSVVSSYSIPLSNLTAGATYSFSLDPFDVSGNEYTSTESHTFNTPPAPLITNVQFQSVPGALTGTETVTWTTNVPTSTQISYSPQSKTFSNGTEAIDSNPTSSHTLTMSGLTYNTPYQLVATSQDALGNVATSDTQVFHTGLDTRPPTISNVIVQPSIKGTGASSSGQVTVSWKTDKPGTSQVTYGQGSSGGYSSKTAEDNSMVTNHVVVVSNLPTSQVFHLQAISKDEAGNTGLSANQTTIIGQATDSALSIVFNALQSVFGL